jgi:hypothetical protein
MIAIFVIIASWLALGTAVALLIGRSVSLADRYQESSSTSAGEPRTVVS